MVCLGNICRSPLAEGILKHKINEQIKQGNQQFSHWEVDSAGTSSFHAGELPDKRSIQVAQENGIDITDQRSRQFRGWDFEEFDLIYVMDQSNYQNVIALANNDTEKSKVRLIMNEVYPNNNQSVPDPYYLNATEGKNGFQQVFDMLDEACDGILKN